MKDPEQNNAHNELLQKFLAGTCTPEEEQKVLRWFYSFNKSEQEERINQGESIADEMNQRINALLDESNVLELKPVGKKLTQISLGLKLTAAAVILIVLGFGFWISLQQRASESSNELAAIIPIQSSINHNDILPGAYFAEISDDKGNNYLNQDSSFFDAKQTDGTNPNKLFVEVPKSGMYKILLEDGTKVWLNSMTKINFPKQFAANERKVELTGEAYFEVAKDADRPFRIEAHGTVIEVLGTVFNVNTYDGKVTTALVEGSVKVSNGNASKLLKPGEEARVDLATIQIQPGNIPHSTAWQRGEIDFEGASLSEILEDLSRWYNVSIQQNVEINDSIKYKGGIARENNLSKVLEILEVATARKFEINGRTIIVN